MLAVEDRAGPEGVLGVDHPEPEPTRKHRADREHDQRHQHHRRALVDMVHGVLVRARRAVEGEPDQPAGVERGQDRGELAHPERVVVELVVRRPGGLEDRILAEEAGEAREADQRQGADPHHRIGDLHLAPDAAHLAHVLLAGHGVDDRTRAQEQQRLEEGMRVEVEDAGRVGADAAGKEHVAELRAGRVGDHPLDVELGQPDRGGKDRRAGTDEGRPWPGQSARTRRAARIGPPGTRRR